MALSVGDHRTAREAFVQMLRVGQSWLLELRKSPTRFEAHQAQRFTEAMEALERTLARNEQLSAQGAPFLLGERVEFEQIRGGTRSRWDEGTLQDCRLAASRSRQYGGVRALDYLVKDRSGEERWVAAEKLRKRAMHRKHGAP